MKTNLTGKEMDQMENMLTGKDINVQIKPILCIYHGNCADGFAAAWVMRKWAELAEQRIEFYPAVYQTGLPKVDLEGRDIFIVDFSYKRAQLLDIADQAERVVILDHHKSAQEDLEGFKHSKVDIVFDMERSGAMITWDYLMWHKEADENHVVTTTIDPPPQLLKHIQDRDLWKFALPYTREIQAAVFSYPYDFKVWDDLMLHTDLHDLITEGTAIERKHFKDIEELVKVCMRWIDIAGYHIPAASLPYTLTSDAGHYMAKTYAPDKFAACYWDTPDGRVYSLRSIEGGRDVSAIAAKYGGGGHKHAAGFKVPLPTIKEYPLP